MSGIIDVCEVVYDDDSWAAYFTALSAVAPRYLRLFAPTLGRRAGMSDLRARVAADPAGAPRILSELAILTRPGRRHQQHLEHLDVQVLHGGHWPLPDGDRVNDRVAAYVATSDRLCFWAGLDLADVHAAVEEAERCTDDLGARGLSLIPFLTASDLTDRRYDPLWELALSRQLPVWVHCGQHFRSDCPVHLNGPQVLDVLAGRHPELVLIAGHAGWPHVDQTLAVAARHESVYLELSSHRPSRLAEPGSGFEPLHSAAYPAARSRVLFGSASWTQGRAPHELAAEIPGEPGLRQRWLYDNAIRLVGVEAGAAR